MKRNLLMMSSLFALALGVASCSSGDDMAQTNPSTSNTRSTELNIYLGNVQIPQTRGADVNGNQWQYKPEYPTEAEKQGILKYVQEHSSDTVKWPGYTYYYVQDVIGAHNKYSYTDNNNAKHDGIDGTSHLDKIEIQENSGNYQHVYNFNAGKCENEATHNATLMTEGFKGARVHDSEGNTDIYNWRLYYYEGNYYLAFDYEMHKNNKEGDIAANGIYDDWIVKIIPGQGEKRVTPDDSTPTPTPENPDTTVTPKDTLEAEVEFDIHQQEHKDWNEIKTSIHVRDTACVRVLIPVPYEYQAVADDFDIRTGAEYTYIEYTEKLDAKFTFADKEYTFPAQINHKKNGIEILIDCTSDDAKEALKLARGVYADGITFEIHSYVNPSATPEQVWGWVKQTYRPGTDTKQWPVDTSICTHVYGQVTSVYYPEQGKKYDERPETTK